EGTILLAQEFGKKYGNYFSILSAIASGRNTTPEIAEAIGDASVGGMLSRLEDDYELISKKRPIMSKERSQNVRYEISDNFLRFWFRYIARNQSIIQMGQFERLSELILSDYPTYSGLTLERWFRERFKESGKYREIGSWWNSSKGRQVDQTEIDIVALSIDQPNQAVVAEVKRQKKNFKPDIFKAKVEHLRNKVLNGYEIKTELLTLEDM
ncbi:MAG: DUF234 domain-containing protein, partial [Muribaculaceae bacterium]|nr:DUF234 domain-containing protein [Muribaculaceae bacterium]